MIITDLSTLDVGHFHCAGDLQRHRKSHDKNSRVKDARNSKGTRTVMYLQEVNKQDPHTDLTCIYCNLTFSDLSAKEAHEQVCERGTDQEGPAVIINSVLLPGETKLEVSSHDPNILLLHASETVEGSLPIVVAPADLSGDVEEGLGEATPTSALQVGEVADALVTLSETPKATTEEGRESPLQSMQGKATHRRM